MICLLSNHEYLQLDHSFELNNRVIVPSLSESDLIDQILGLYGTGDLNRELITVMTRTTYGFVAAQVSIHDYDFSYKLLPLAILELLPKWYMVEFYFDKA